MYIRVNDGNGAYIAAPERINISSDAHNILKSDEKSFDIIKKSNIRKNKDKVCDTIINLIINNMDISEIPEDSDETNKKEKDPRRFNFKPDKEAYEKLKTAHYTGKYVSKLLEIYSEKPYYERELICFGKCIETIYNASANSKLIAVKYRGNNMLICPYKILTDEWSSYNYLIGTRIPDSPNGKPKLINLRIAYISECRPVENTYSCSFSDDYINQRIRSSGIQFISEEPEKIRVRLPEGKNNGKDMYDHMVFMRPPIYEMPTPDAPDIYTFYCTTKQAEYYFFKFGQSAEIIEPKDLRDKFKEKYESALKQYK